MTVARKIGWTLLVIAIAAGTISDRPVRRAPLELDGYRVLAGDFHVHPFPFSAGTLAPWDIVLEARRQGLDVIAITPHNSVLMGRIGRWFSRLAGGPTVIAGQEIHGPLFHVVALGTRSYISWRLSASDTLDEVHRQGGVAIAAHPLAQASAAYDDATRRKLDGSEVCQPTIYQAPSHAKELETFYTRAPIAAIGSSDYHGLGPLGVCRTYVFARDDSEQAVLDAIRAHRTVVVFGGRTYGDPALTGFAAQLPPAPVPPSRWSAVCGIVGLLLCCWPTDQGGA
jgi:hypothetical protein